MTVLANDLKGVSIETLQAAIAEAVNKVIDREDAPPYQCDISQLEFGSVAGATMQIKLWRSIRFPEGGNTK